MAISKTTTAECVHCGAKHRITVYPVIDPDDTPGLVSRAENGTFFQHKCNKCGKKYNVWYPVMYLDPLMDIMICYSTNVQEMIETQQAVLERRKDFENEQDDDCIIRVTNSPHAFREKIKLFNDGFDDRVVEIMKTQVSMVGHTRNAIENVKEVFCWPDGDKFHFDFICSGSSEVISTEVSMALYDLIYNKLINLIDEQHPNPTEVDLDWAMNFLDRNDIKIL